MSLARAPLPAVLLVLATACALLPGAALGHRAAREAPRGGARPVPAVVVGDSLAVGLRDSLPKHLGEEAVFNAVNGRTTPSGFHALRGLLRWVRPRVVVVSLGTNDGPRPERFRRRLRRTLAQVPRSTCVAWVALWRPPRKGPFRAMNDVLRAETARDRRLVVVPWDEAVDAGAVALPDGLHPDAAGYAERSRMIASTLRRRCGASAGARRSAAL